MLNKRKLFSVLSVLCLGVIFGGCSLEAKPADVTTETPTKVLTGTITAANGLYFLKDATGVSTALESRKIDLAVYAGQAVTVTGEFSGTTLFVDEVE